MQDSVDQGLTEEHVRRLPMVEYSDMFTEAEKAAIVFCQKVARDHSSVGDEDYARLHKYFSEKEIVEICMLVAQFVGVGRMLATIDAWEPVCEIA
jgi:alkylhydroperoxidase family enzyme